MGGGRLLTAGIIGLGYVGLTLAITAASCGIEVYGIEINEHIKNCLGENRAHFYEPGLDTIIERVNGNQFHLVEEFPSDVPMDVFVITVGTPLLDGQKTPNFDYIRSALMAIKPAYVGGGAACNIAFHRFRGDDTRSCASLFGRAMRQASG